MIPWIEIEARFKEMEPLMRDFRIDAQWGSSGEHWRIAGARDVYTTKRFEAVARIAGEKLRHMLLKTPDAQKEIIDEVDPARCWYKGLAYMSKSLKYEFTAQDYDDKGEPVGHIYTGSIYRIAEASAIFCLELSSRLPDSSPEAIIGLKPEFHGISIDLRALWRRLKSFFAG